MTKTAKRILARMAELVAEGTWTAVPSHSPTIRHTENVETPEIHRGNAFGRWSKPTYDRHCFLTLTHGGVILGDVRAPWMGRMDSDIPYWLAEAIMADAELAHDSDRRLALVQKRRAARVLDLASKPGRALSGGVS